MTRIKPPLGCALCPRLSHYREENRRRLPDYFNNPVGVWGDPGAAVLIVGLAPGLHGANRTGRPFTGDASGDLLLPTLCTAGLAEERGGAVTLLSCGIINAVACVPPQNRPLGVEVANCAPYLRAALEADAQVVLTLGKLAHDAVLRGLGARVAQFPFGHGAQFEIAGRSIIASYHPSRYNVQTKRLTPMMFGDVVSKAARTAGVYPPSA